MNTKKIFEKIWDSLLSFGHPIIKERAEIIYFFVKPHLYTQDKEHGSVLGPFVNGQTAFFHNQRNI